MTPGGWLLLGLGACLCLLIVVRDWRLALPLLAGAGIALAGFVWTEGLVAPNLPVAQSRLVLVAVDLATLVTVVLILLVTGLTYDHDYNVEDLDEFGITELRRAARRAAHIRLSRRWSDYVPSLLALLMVIAATVFLPRLFLESPREIDYAWTILLLSGLLLILTADMLLQIGLGLLLLAFGLKLFYLSVATRAGLLELALLNIVTIVLALVTAYLSGLLYGRLKTLDLETMFRGR